MIVPSISIFALATVVLSSADNRVNRRQTFNADGSIAIGGVVNATPAQALAAGSQANSAVAQIIQSIVDGNNAAAALLSSLSSASVARTAVHTTTTTTATSTSATTSPSAACLIPSTTNNYYSSIVVTEYSVLSGPTNCSAACQPLTDASNACINQSSTGADIAKCSCSITLIQAAQKCAACADSILGGTYGFGNSTNFCFECIDAVNPTIPASTCVGPRPAATCAKPNCPDGQGVTDFSADNRCTTCNAGSSSSNVTYSTYAAPSVNITYSSCRGCPNAQYQPNPGMASCINCSFNATSDFSATAPCNSTSGEPYQCAKNYGLAGSPKTCQACPTGTTSFAGGNTCQ